MACMVLINQPACQTVLMIVKRAWENTDVSLCVQEFHRSQFEIVTTAAASILMGFACTPNGVNDQSARCTSNGGCAFTWLPMRVQQSVVSVCMCSVYHYQI